MSAPAVKVLPHVDNAFVMEAAERAMKRGASISPCDFVVSRRDHASADCMQVTRNPQY